MYGCKVILITATIQGDLNNGYGYGYKVILMTATR